MRPFYPGAARSSQADQIPVLAEPGASRPGIRRRLRSGGVIIDRHSDIARLWLALFLEQECQQHSRPAGRSDVGAALRWPARSDARSCSRRPPHCPLRMTHGRTRGQPTNLAARESEPRQESARHASSDQLDPSCISLGGLRVVALPSRAVALISAAAANLRSSGPAAGDRSRAP